MKNLTNQSRIALAFALMCVVFISGTLAFAQEPKPPSQVQDTAAVGEQRAFLKQYCVTCHSDKLHTAGLSLEGVNLSDVTQSGESLEKVVRQLRGGAMPPPSMPRPPQAKLQAFVTSLETSLDQAASAHPNPGRPMMLHRLNRTEYLNAVHDLFQADLSPRDASLLPPDD